MKRREALKTMGAMAGAAVGAKFLPGCGDDPRPPGIDHVVVMMLENRSYDHLLGARALQGLGGDGLTAAMSNPNMAGQDIPVYEATTGQFCVPDPPHGWSAARDQFSGGTNQGFVLAQEAEHGAGQNGPMQYLTRATVPVSWALADAYTSCDRYFCSVMGPTWPNRMYWHAASSNGIMVNELPSGGFNWPSIHQRANDAGVDWRYYYGTIPVLGLVHNLDKQGHVRLMEDFFRDCMSGNLAPINHVDPSFFVNDDHPPLHPAYAQQLIASVYTALAASPVWERCLFVVTYDEHGGFFDHVPPPTTVDDFAATGFDQMGFRVPTIIAGPYVKQGVSSTVRDHCSVLAHLERQFGLAPLNQRTMAANDLSDVIDTERLMRGDASPPISLPAVEIDESMLGADCAMMTARMNEHPMHQLADRYPHLFVGYDNRAHARDQLYLIGDFLEQHNAGRIVRGR